MVNNTSTGIAPYERLTAHLRRLRSRVLARTMGRGLLAVLGKLAVVGTLALIFQGLLGPRLDLGVALGVTFLVYLALVGWQYILRPLVHFPSLRRFAMVVDREIADDHDDTINALDLGRRREQETDPLSRALIDHAIDRNLPRVFEITPARLDRGPRVRPHLVALAMVALVLVGFHLLAPLRLKASFLALLNPTRFPYAPSVVIEVNPGDDAVDTGTDLQVKATITGTDDLARLQYRKEGGAWKSTGMAQTSRNAIPWEGQLDGSRVTVTQQISRSEFELTLAELRRNTEYRVVVGDEASETFLVRVMSPPRVAGYRIHIDYPDYTGLPDDKHVAPVGNVAALLGSEVAVAFETEGELGEATVEWADGREENLGAAADDAPLAFVVGEPTEYRVRMTDHNGKTRFESPFFPVQPLADREPVVRVVEPGTDIDVPEGMKLPLTVTCADDYGISRLLLHVHKEPHDPYPTEIQSFEMGTRETMVEFVWDLGSLDLLPGEVATYWFELFDNDAITGAKSSRTPVYEVRFPSMAELYERTEEEYAENVVDAVEDIHEAERQLHERLETLRQELERSREGITWERQKEVEGMLESQQAIQQELSQAMESLQRSVDQLGENNMSNFQILERMQAIQNLLQEIDDERLQAVMEQVREALENMDPRQLQEALDTFELTQEEILQQLDRAAEHLKQLLAEQKLEAMINQVQEMVNEQAELNDALDPEDDEDAGEATDEAGEDDLAQADPLDEAEGDEAGTEGDDATEGSEGEEGTEGTEGDEAEAGDQTDPSESESGEESASEESSEGDSESSESEAGETESSESESEASESDSASESESSESEASEQESSESESSPSEPSESMTPEEMQAMAERQEELAKQLEELMEQLQELQQMAQQSHPQMDQALQEQSPQESGEEAQNAMEQAMEQMRQQRDDFALRYGLEAEESLQQMANSLMQSSQQMQANQTDELSREMMALGADLLHISNKQEVVVDSPDGATTRDMAAQEMRLYEATGRAAEKLDEIGRQTMFINQGMLRNMGAILDDMNRATTLYEGGNRSRGAREAQAAMSGLNRTVMDLLRVQQQMSQSAGSCSNPNPMNRIPSMSQMQQQINQQTQSLQRKMGQQRISPATGQEALRQLAARQEAVRRGIEEIAGDLQDRRDVLGRVDELGKEIEDVVDQMEQGKVNRELLQRQEKILSRLLAAERSIRKQDQDERRVSRVGDDADRASPAGIDENELGRPERIELDIMQGRSDPYPPRYRSMIEAYFKALGGGK